MKLSNALKRLVWPTREPSPEADTDPRAGLADQIKELEIWRGKNPGRPVKDWYRERMQDALAGGSHSTIGGNLRSGEFDKAGDKEFAALLRYGLKPTDTCVDYGCGTLRIGQHVIRHLGAGQYWGFDISQDFLDVGQALIGDELLSSKAPKLHVINKDSVADVAGKHPTFLFSYKVMQHVHPDELTEYLGNITTIIGLSGRALVFSKWSEHETIHYKAMGWAHSLAVIRAQVQTMGARLSVIEGRRKTLPLEVADAGESRPVIAGAFQMVRA